MAFHQRSHLVLWLALTGVSLAFAGCGAHKSPPPRGPAVVGVVTIVAQPVTLTTELPGRTSPFEVADVRPQVGGIIIARPFTEGGNVRAGEVLYRIDPAPYQAALDQAKGLLGSAEANLITTQNKAERYAELVKINAVSKQDADDANAAYKQAVADSSATEGGRRGGKDQSGLHPGHGADLRPGRPLGVHQRRPGHPQPDDRPDHGAKARSHLCGFHPVRRRGADASPGDGERQGQRRRAARCCGALEAGGRVDLSAGGAVAIHRRHGRPDAPGR